MNVLLIATSEFAGNSALHTLSVARFLQSRGVECAVSYRSDEHNVRPRGNWPFRVCDHGETMHNGVLYPDGRGPDLIHTWTPREHVRKLTERMVERYGCPYIVHLEDNEEVILADTLGRFSFGELAELPTRIVERVISPYLSHPRNYRSFLEGAAGITALIGGLMEFKLPNAPGVVFWPGFEEGILTAKGTRKSFGLPPDGALLVYNGNIHLSNEEEVVSLIEAVRLLNERGTTATLVKTGANHAAFEKLQEAQEEGYLIDLGFVTRGEIHSLLNLADVLVQPGHASAFNDYRFPCKLPEFLATGKPVILPKTNLGLYLQDGENCLLMESGDPEEIADKVELLLRDSDLSAKIGVAGAEFAKQRLSWEKNLEPVLDLYRQVLKASATSFEMKRQDPTLVELDRQTAPGDVSERYLAMAVRSIAAGTGVVAQRVDGDPWVYEKWLAAEVERAMGTKNPRIQVTGWLEDSEWIEATDRGYATGVGNYLRRAGLGISDLVLEQALGNDNEPEREPARAKTENWISDTALWRIIRLYSGTYQVPAFSYGTVKDFCDSVDEMRSLATVHGDLKNVQRPWAVKAVLGMIPPGSRILEIGAGEPWVADILSRAGYEVWVVDPYDSSYNGPTELEKFSRECPDVRFIRDEFSDGMLDLPAGCFDCVYSVSVLEHLDADGLRAVAAGIAKFLKPEGLTIHAIDYVQRGTGHAEDLERLELLTSLFGLDPVELHVTLQRMDRDLEVYTLSAEGLNQWRGSLPYEKFRMRKWVSFQMVADGARVARSLAAAGRP